MFSYQVTGHQWKALKHGCKWMLDNGAFTNNFDFRRWVRYMALMLPYRKNCLGIVVPDVPFDSMKTIERFYLYKAIPEALGYKTALATQNGLTSEATPWSDFDVLFIGGDDAHKRGLEAHRLIKSGLQNKKWVHVGRVSSGSAILKYWSNAHSWDGTTFTRGKVGGEEEESKMYRLNKVLGNLKKERYTKMEFGI